MNINEREEMLALLGYVEKNYSIREDSEAVAYVDLLGLALEVKRPGVIFTAALNGIDMSLNYMGIVVPLDNFVSKLERSVSREDFLTRDLRCEFAQLDSGIAIPLPLAELLELPHKEYKPSERVYIRTASGISRPYDWFIEYNQEVGKKRGRWIKKPHTTPSN